MCRHCVNGRMPVRLLDDDGSEGDMIGYVTGCAVVDNVGTVYLHLDDGRDITATVVEWYGPGGRDALAVE